MDRIAEWIIPAVDARGRRGSITFWMAGAIYFDVCHGAVWSRWLAAGWAAGVIALFVAWQPLWQPFAVLLGVAALFLGWWLRLKPSHDRDWDPTVAVLPRAVLAGEVVTIENVRNFEYRSLDDFTQRYETRTVHLANLKAVDIIFFNWGSPWMSHPVLVFDFGLDGRVCMSIEARHRKGQEYSVLRSFYRQQELIFSSQPMSGDAIGRRTKYGRDQAAYLYRFTASTEELRATFLDYIEAINRRFTRSPRWSPRLCAPTAPRRSIGCLIAGRRWDWRVLANGRLDKALYEDGRLDRTLPFPDLRRSAYLNEIANSAPEEGFGDHIRRELERRRHER